MPKYSKKHYSVIHNPCVIGALFKGIRIKNCRNLLIVLLVGILLLCNVLWIYTTWDYFHKEIPRDEAELWNTTNKEKNSIIFSNHSVHGIGLEQISNFFTIPEDTVLFGSDQLFKQDDQRHKFSEQERRFMTIGISSVWRKEYYLYQTIDSLIEHTSEKEKLDINIFLLLADADPLFRYERAKAIESRYRQHVESGLLRILQPPSSLYPSIDFSKIRLTYNDSVEKVQWRTKQVFDFAFLFHYTFTQDSSQYFLLLEDDILSAKHFVSATKDFVKLHKHHHWITLQLAGFWGIGKLIRCRDLNRLASFLLLFYTEQPVDLLLTFWASLMIPEEHPKGNPSIRFPSLFQHIGIQSTMANKTQLLKDKTFRFDNRLPNHINPPANLTTTMNQSGTFGPKLAYDYSSPGLFWGKSKPNDTLDIVFSQPLHLSRLYISTGNYVENSETYRMMDKLMFGHVEVSSKFQEMKTPKKASCTKFEYLKSFKNGELEFEGFPELFPLGVQCIRIVVDPPQEKWVAITEIAVFTINDINLTSD